MSAVIDFNKKFKASKSSNRLNSLIKMLEKNVDRTFCEVEAKEEEIKMDAENMFKMVESENIDWTEPVTDKPRKPKEVLENLMTSDLNDETTFVDVCEDSPSKPCPTSTSAIPESEKEELFKFEGFYSRRNSSKKLKVLRHLLDKQPILKNSNSLSGLKNSEQEVKKTKFGMYSLRLSNTNGIGTHYNVNKKENCFDAQYATDSGYDVDRLSDDEFEIVPFERVSIHEEKIKSVNVLGEKISTWLFADGSSEINEVSECRKKPKRKLFTSKRRTFSQKYKKFKVGNISQPSFKVRELAAKAKLPSEVEDSLPEERLFDFGKGSRTQSENEDKEGKQILDHKTGFDESENSAVSFMSQQISEHSPKNARKKINFNDLDEPEVTPKEEKEIRNVENMCQKVALPKDLKDCRREMKNELMAEIKKKPEVAKLEATYNFNEKLEELLLKKFKETFLESLKSKLSNSFEETSEKVLNSIFQGDFMTSTSEQNSNSKTLNVKINENLTNVQQIPSESDATSSDSASKKLVEPDDKSPCPKTPAECKIKTNIDSTNSMNETQNANISQSERLRSRKKITVDAKSNIYCLRRRKSRAEDGEGSEKANSEELSTVGEHQVDTMEVDERDNINSNTKSHSSHQHLYSRKNSTGRMHNGEKDNTSVKMIHKCFCCDFTSAEYQKVLAHLKSHIVNSGLKCLHRNLSASQKSECIDHLRAHEGKAPLKCSVCAFRAVSCVSLNRHMEIHSFEQRYKCKTCGYRTKTMSEITAHVRLHSEPRSNRSLIRYKCNSCDFRTSNLASISEHTRNRCRPQNEPKSIPKLKYGCDICPASYSRKKELNIHVKRHRSKSRYECPLCMYVCQQNWRLKRHLSSHSNRNIVPLYCSYCKFFTKIAYNMMLHMRSHYATEEQSPPGLSCSICLKGFDNVEMLTAHMQRIHSVSLAKVNIPGRSTEFRKVEYSDLPLINSSRRTENAKVFPVIPYSTEESIKLSERIFSNVESVCKLRLTNESKDCQALNRKVDTTGETSKVIASKLTKTPGENNSTNSRTVTSGFDNGQKTKSFHFPNAEIQQLKPVNNKRLNDFDPQRSNSSKNIPLIQPQTAYSQNEMPENEIKKKNPEENTPSPSSETKLNQVINGASSACEKLLAKNNTAVKKETESEDEAASQESVVENNSSSDEAIKSQIDNIRKEAEELSVTDKNGLGVFAKSAHFIPVTVKQEYLYECSYCEFGADKLFQLNFHLMEHSHLSPFECSFCPETFSHPNDLKDHMNRHSDDDVITL